MTKEHLIALRLSTEELAALDSLGENRSLVIRELIWEAGGPNVAPNPVDDPHFDPRYEDGDYAHDVAREDGR